MTRARGRQFPGHIFPDDITSQGDHIKQILTMYVRRILHLLLCGIEI